MIQFIMFAALAWFVISMIRDMMRISEQKAIEQAKKEAREARDLARAEADAARAEARAKAKAAKAAKAAEDMVSCEICGTHTPKQEAIATQGKFYCSEEHFLQRNKAEQPAEAVPETPAETIPQATAENV
jgi:late competence protein required for DNA uptake (superfamily II DNA/RNA helicase)